jgi:cytosine/adenosine deaminase-related metal-dependent hydrolase
MPTGVPQPSEPAEGRILIHDATIITADPADQVISPGDLVIHGDRIVHVGSAEGAASLHRQGTFERVIDGSRHVVIPGLVNAHTHTYATLFKGSYERMPLDLWLAVMRAPTRALDRDLLELSSTMAAVEMAKTGTTTALDHFFGNPELPGAGIEAEIAGMRRVGVRHAVATVLMDLPWEETLPLDEEAVAAARSAADDVTRRETAQGLEGAAAFIEMWHRSHPLTTCLIGPSAAHRCSDALLRGSRELADRTGAGIHLHLGEAKTHALRSRELFGATLVGRLDRLGVLAPDVSMAHGVWLTDAEFDILARSGASIVHNPASNLKLGSGVARVREMRRRGVNVAVATDGPCSSDNFNMFEALRLGGLLHTTNQEDPEDWLSAREVFRMATIDAARAAGLDGEVGSLETGKRADLVMLRRDSVAWAAWNDPFVQLVYAENGSSVDRVFVNGAEIVTDGRVNGLDEVALFREVDAARRALQPAVDASWAAIAPLAGPIGRMGRAMRTVNVDVAPEQRFR